MTDDLVTFLRARLDEDEAAAKAAGSRWYLDVDGNVQDREGGGGNNYVAVGPYGGSVEDVRAGHILRHDPARVLRDVEAKRAILFEHEPDVREQGWCSRCRIIRDDEVWVGRVYPCPTLRALASVYSDHPDYRQDWAPDAPAPRQ